MQLASIRRSGVEQVGLLYGGELIDLDLLLAPDETQRRTTMRELIGTGFAQARDAVSQLEALPPDTVITRKLAVDTNSSKLILPIPDPERILCVGQNYAAHAQEPGKRRPGVPTFFIRMASSLAPPGEPLVRPAISNELDWEGELAVVIGRPIRHISAKDAMSAVAGYTIFNDGSVRDYQHAVSQWTAGKNFFHSGSFGPYLTTADQIPDPSRLRLRTRLNGETMQDANVGDMIFSVAAIVAFASTFTPLSPGDIIALGTPPGVGNRQRPPRYLDEGDVVTVEIDGLGVLENSVVREAHQPWPGAD